MRIGIMGAGDVANFGHAPAINATPGLELAAVYDPLPGRAADFARRHSAAASFDDPDAFLDSGLDGVVVASSAFAHRENVLLCAARKLPVLCEKPIADDEGEAEEMIRAMAVAGANLSIGYVYRFSPVAQQIKQWLEANAIGRLRVIRLQYLWHLHGQWMQDETGKWIVSPYFAGRMKAGGPFVDCGVHFIDLARWWTGSEIRSTDSQGAWVSDRGYEYPDHIWTHSFHENGVQTASEVSFTYGHTAREPAPLFSYDLIGDGGVIRYDRNGWALTLRNGEGTKIGPQSSEKGFWEMYAAWRDAIASGDFRAMPSAQDGLIATQIAVQATELLHKP